MADRDIPIHPAVEAGFMEVAQAMLSTASLDVTLRRIVMLATEAVEGCTSAGIFMFEAGTVVTPAASDQLVLEIDRLQKESGEGPCLDAINEAVVEVEDLVADHRWPTFGPQAVVFGIRSVLALQLADGTAVSGALNLYSAFPRAFGVNDRTNALLLASAAGMALSREQAHSDHEQLRREREHSENLEVALVTRTVIGQAQGILIEREHVTAEQAFDMLRRASQRLNVKVRDVAQRVVDAGNTQKKE